MNKILICLLFCSLCYGQFVRYPAYQNFLSRNDEVIVYNPIDANTTYFWRSDSGITLVSTKVSQWNDQIGTFDFLQGTDANRPIFNSDSVAMYFTATPLFMATTSSPTIDTSTFSFDIYTLIPNKDTTGTMICEYQNSTNLWQFQVNPAGAGVISFQATKADVTKHNTNIASSNYTANKRTCFTLGITAGTSVNWYVNGVSATPTTTYNVKSNFNNTGTFRIGKLEINAYFRGYIWAIRISNKVRSQAEHNNFYNWCQQTFIYDPDITPPIQASSIIADTNGTDSVDVTVVYGATEYDSIRIQRSTSSITSRTNGTNLYAGHVATTVFHYKHNLTNEGNQYVKIYLADASGNWNTGKEDTLIIPDMWSPLAGSLNITVEPIGMATLSILSFGGTADLASVYLDLWNGSAWVNVFSEADSSIDTTIENSAVNSVPFNPDSLLKARLRLYDEAGNNSAAYDTTNDDSLRLITVVVDTPRSVVQALRAFISADSNGTKLDSCYVLDLDTNSVGADSIQFKVYSPTDTMWYATRPRIASAWGTIGAWYQYPQGGEAAPPDYSDITFFWPVESDDVGTDNGYSAGDSTATLYLNTIEAAGGIIGTKGILCDDAATNGYAGFTPTSIISGTMTIGMYIGIIADSTVEDGQFVYRFETDAEAYQYTAYWTPADGNDITMKVWDGTNFRTNVFDVNLVAGTDYFIQFRIDPAGDKISLKVNGGSWTESSKVFTPLTFVAADMMRFAISNANGSFRVDNIMISTSLTRDFYDEGFYDDTSYPGD